MEISTSENVLFLYSGNTNEMIIFFTNSGKIKKINVKESPIPNNLLDESILSNSTPDSI